MLYIALQQKHLKRYRRPGNGAHAQATMIAPCAEDPAHSSSARLDAAAADLRTQNISPSRFGGRNQDHSMKQDPPSLLSRISLAFGTFFAIIADGQFAARVQALRAGEQRSEPSAPAPVAPRPVAVPLREAAPDGALQLLGLLQREARFIDFIQEDVADYTDADIGAAVRVVHEGCRKVLHDSFTIAPVRDEAEGSRITLPAGFDAAAIRVTGNVVGQPPFKGSITHRGWRVLETRLPKLSGSHELRIVAPAEVEL